jgi:hypothetical protein
MLLFCLMTCLALTAFAAEKAQADQWRLADFALGDRVPWRTPLACRVGTRADISYRVVSTLGIAPPQARRESPPRRNRIEMLTIKGTAVVGAVNSESGNWRTVETPQLFDFADAY